MEKLDLDPEESQLDTSSWLSSSTYEVIAGTRYCLWKPGQIAKPEQIAFSRTFLIGVPVLWFVCLFGARAVVKAVEAGNFVVGQTVSLSLLVLLYVLPLALLGWETYKRKTTVLGPEILPPSEVPGSAVAAMARLAGRGSSLGWLWFEGPWMHFRGAGFDFRLQRADFRRRNATRALRGHSEAGLKRPRGISAHTLVLIPAWLTSSGATSDPTKWKALEPQLEYWSSCTPVSDPSLYPPLRPVPREARKIQATNLRWTSLTMAVLLGSVPAIVPIDRQLVSPRPLLESVGLFALSGALLGLCWNLLLVSVDGQRKSALSEVEKLVRKENQPR